VRIYLPATLGGLATAGVGAADAPSQVEIAAAGSWACAVTPALREWYREGDIDELEYAALTRAAIGSLRLLAESGSIAGGEHVPRRVVLAVDVPDNAVVLAPDADPAAIMVIEPVRLDQVICAHVDDPSAADDIAAAAGVVEAADAGDDDAQFVIDGLGDHELQWYAGQEIPFLLD
jgi:hypothetical protein